MAIIKIRNAAIDLDAAEIPNLPATKITSGTFDNARISLDAAEIPNLDTAKITTGTLADARVPDLNASKITAGTIAAARLGSGTANSSTFLRGDNTFASAGGDMKPNFHIGQSGGQNIANNTLTKMTFDSEIFDANDVWNTSTNKLTLPSGKFLINFFCTHYGSSYSEGGNIYIYKNGSQEMMPFSDKHRNSELPNSHHASLWGSAIVESDGDDYFEFYFWGITDTGNNFVTYKKIQGFKIID